MAKDSLWFKHDLNARNDLKTEAMIDDYGAQGYGTYWWIVEKLHEERNSIHLDELFYRNVSKKMKWKVLGKLQKFLQDCADRYNLFKIDENILSARRVEKNLKELKISAEQLSEKRSEAGKKGAEKRWQNDGKTEVAILPMANDGKNGIDKNRIDKIREEERVGTHALAIYDAEKEILANQIEFQRIYSASKKSEYDAKEELRNYHLYLTEKEQYPKGRKAVFAGFEKWLRNGKHFIKNKPLEQSGQTINIPSRFKDIG